MQSSVLLRSRRLLPLALMTAIALIASIAALPATAAAKPDNAGKGAPAAGCETRNNNT